MITNFKRVDNGQLREAAFRELLTGARYPTRNVDQNMADLRAQIAANEKGREELLRMVEHFGLDVVRAYMGHVQDNAEESVRRVITALKPGSFELKLDNGACVKVAISVDRPRREATIDFVAGSHLLVAQCPPARQPLLTRPAGPVQPRHADPVADA